MRWDWVAAAVAVGLIVTLVVGLGRALDKSNKNLRLEQIEWEEKNAWVQPGAFVRVKLTGDKAQVRYSYAYSSKVYCLVASGRRYRDGLVSADSFKSEYVEVKFHIDELEPWGDK